MATTTMEPYDEKHGVKLMSTGVPGEQYEHTGPRIQGALTKNEEANFNDRCLDHLRVTLPGGEAELSRTYDPGLTWKLGLSARAWGYAEIILAEVWEEIAEKAESAMAAGQEAAQRMVWECCDAWIIARHKAQREYRERMRSEQEQAAAKGKPIVHAPIRFTTDEHWRFARIGMRSVLGGKYIFCEGTNYAPNPKAEDPDDPWQWAGTATRNWPEQRVIPGKGGMHKWVRKKTETLPCMPALCPIFTAEDETYCQRMQSGQRKGDLVRSCHPHLYLLYQPLFEQRTFTRWDLISKAEISSRGMMRSLNGIAKLTRGVFTDNVFWLSLEQREIATYKRKVNIWHLDYRGGSKRLEFVGAFEQLKRDGTLAQLGERFSEPVRAVVTPDHVRLPDGQEQKLLAEAMAAADAEPELAQQAEEFHGVEAEIVEPEPPKADTRKPSPPYLSDKLDPNSPLRDIIAERPAEEQEVCWRLVEVMIGKEYNDTTMAGRIQGTTMDDLLALEEKFRREAELEEQALGNGGTQGELDI